MQSIIKRFCIVAQICIVVLSGDIWKSQIINKSIYIMEKEKVEDDDCEFTINVSRASTIGHQTSDHNYTEHVIHEIIHYHGLDLPAFVQACAEHPHIKDETKLIAEIFEKRELIEDLISFLVNPQKMVDKYQLSESKGRRFVNIIRDFLYESYQFYEHYFLKVEERQLGHQIWFQFLENKVNEIYYSSLGYLSDIFLPIIKYQYSTSSRVTEYFEKNYNNQRSILIISQFDEALISKLLRYSHLQAIFKILFHIVLASLQEQQWKKSLNLLKMLCQSSIQMNATLDDRIENVHMMLKDVSNNIEKDIHNTIFAFTDAFVQSNLVEASINRIRSLFENSASLRNASNFESSEETILEFNIKVMAEVVNIYYLLRKIGIDYMAHQMVKLKANILQIYVALDSIMALMRGVQSRTVRFSNGQNIKASVLYRFQLLNLLRLCLTVLKQFGQTCPQLQSKIDKSLVLEFIMRCLSENRWNNIMHFQVEKVLCLIVNPDLFKSKSACVQRFLKFLVETFSNKKYMFLNSAKMINQGDIHTLYFIARKITVEMDRTPGIVDISNEYDFWKQFVLNVLQKYENNNERLSKISTESDYETCERMDGDLRVEIDELASIKQIVKKFEINQKWSASKKEHHDYGISRVGSASSLNKPKIMHQKSEKMGSPIIHKTALSIKKLKSNEGEDHKEEEGDSSGKKKTVKKVESLPNNLQEIDMLYATSSHSDSEVGDEQQYVRKMEGKY